MKQAADMHRPLNSARYPTKQAFVQRVKLLVIVDPGYVCRVLVTKYCKKVTFFLGRLTCLGIRVLNTGYILHFHPHFDHGHLI